MVRVTDTTGKPDRLPCDASGRRAMRKARAYTTKGQHMKQGKSIMELAAEIQRQAGAKHDYIVDTRNLSATVVKNDGKEDVQLSFKNGTQQLAPATDLAHRQIGERVQIPAKYYDRMKAEAPELLAANLNVWFQKKPEARMLRTLDGNVRAFLSNRYSRIDNIHVAETVLPILSQTAGIEVVSAEVTERKLYIKAVSHSVRAEIKSKRVGDFIEAGVMISNSEVGMGAISVQPFYHFLACTNGMVRMKGGMRSAHIGTKQDADENIAALLADDTRKAEDRAILLKIRDVMAAAMNQDQFNKAIDAMQQATGDMVTGDPAKTIELLADEFTLTDNERGGVLRHLIEGGDLSRYGLMNAITRTGEDAENYDRATEFEVMGGRILDLPKSDWQRLALAA